MQEEAFYMDKVVIGGYYRFPPLPRTFAEYCKNMNGMPISFCWQFGVALFGDKIFLCLVEIFIGAESLSLVKVAAKCNDSSFVFPF